MRIVVKGREALKELASEQCQVAIVSISDDPADFPDIPSGCVCLAVLRQHFHDVEANFAADMFEPHFAVNIEPKKAAIEAFTEAQATEVAKFVKALPAEVGTLVLQCEVGISRSAGMAAAVARHLGYDDMPFFRDHLPNRRVYRMTLEALRQCR